MPKKKPLYFSARPNKKSTQSVSKKKKQANYDHHIFSNHKLRIKQIMSQNNKFNKKSQSNHPRVKPMNKF